MTTNVSLLEFLSWIISAGGAGGISFWIMENVKWLVGRSSEERRYWSIGIPAVIAIAAWGFTVLFGYTPVPETWQGWFESLFSVAFVAAGGASLLHGRLVLSKKGK